MNVCSHSYGNMLNRSSRGVAKEGISKKLATDNTAVLFQVIARYIVFCFKAISGIGNQRFLQFLGILVSSGGDYKYLTQKKIGYLGIPLHSLAKPERSLEG